jgi:anthranilate phosphoribosyltransferase
MNNGSLVKETIERLSQGMDLSKEEASRIFLAIMEGELTPAQIGGILVGLKAKGETHQEVAAAADAMLSKAIKVHPKGECIDTCGTGGDGKGTLNISTLTAFVVAACGVKVAKHGNRSVSSSCGSADLLEALGIPITQDAEAVERSMEETGFGFIFAPAFHPAMKHAMGPRRELGTRTIFNLLGPIVNPARPAYQMVGVYHESLLPLVGEALLALGRERVCVVHSEDGLDEASVAAATRVWFGTVDGKRREFTVSPEDLGMKRRSLGEIVGGEAGHNAQIAEEVLKGKGCGARDAVLINAALALYTAGLEDLQENLSTAAYAIDSGAAKGVVERLRGSA